MACSEHHSDKRSNEEAKVWENILKLHVAKMIKKQGMQRVRNTQLWKTSIAQKRVGRTFVQKPHDTYVTGYGVG